MASLTQKLEECLAAAYAAALTGGPVREILARGKILGTAPTPELVALVDLIAARGGASITVPYFQMRVALARDPSIAPRIERALRLFLYWVLISELLPQIKIGEGIGQARKLVRRVAVAIRDGDSTALPQLAACLETAQWNSKDQESRFAIGAAHRIARGELIGWGGKYEMLLRRAAAMPGLADRLGALLRDAVAEEPRDV